MVRSNECFAFMHFSFALFLYMARQQRSLNENCKHKLISRNEKTGKSNTKRNLLVTAAKKLVMSLHSATEIEKIFLPWVQCNLKTLFLSN